MSARPGIIASVRNPTANGGESPNAYVALVIAELRVYWPPLATDAEVLDAINEIHRLALQLSAQRRAAI